MLTTAGQEPVRDRLAVAQPALIAAAPVRPHSRRR
jgi:hypothetical protein